MEIAIGRMRSRRFRAEGMGLAPADREAAIHGHPVRPRARQRALFRQPPPLDPEVALETAPAVGALRATRAGRAIDRTCACAVDVASYEGSQSRFRPAGGTPNAS